ncbi:MAG: glycosyltransferase family 25 protein [Rhodobacterales bacterium]|nr:glycosyltransferase family 25 protein [Rhodobacterales bacterium]
MRAYVLHLTRATKRRDNATALLKNCGLAGLVWPAIDGAATDGAELRFNYRRHLFTPAYPHELRVGELGCFASHRAIWADMQTRPEEAALILEDDAGIDPALLPDALDLAARHVQRLGYIQLQTRGRIGRAVVFDRCGACILSLPVVPGLRTTAQVVSRSAAAHLLEHSETFDRPVDTWLQSHWHTGIRPAVIYPSGILEMEDKLHGSTIQIKKKSLREKANREVLRALYRLAVRRAAAISDAPHPE